MKAVPKLIQYFLLCMLALTFVSWKLDAARTPLVQAAEASSEMLPDETGVMMSYGCVVPQDALVSQGGTWFLYLLEPPSDMSGDGTPLWTAVRTEVDVLAQDGSMAAVSGFYAEDMQIVLYSTQPLRHETVVDELWSGEQEGGLP